MSLQLIVFFAVLLGLLALRVWQVVTILRRPDAPPPRAPRQVPWY